MVLGFSLLGGERRSWSSPSDGVLDESDLMLMLSYALGSVSEHYGCLHRTACEEPDKAQSYSAASKMILNAAKIFKT